MDEGERLMAHWRKIYNTDYIGSWDFDDGKAVTITVATIKEEKVTNHEGKESARLVVYTERGEKGLVLNVTKCKQMEQANKTSEWREWVGTTITLGTKKTKAFGEWVEAVAIVKAVAGKSAQPATTGGTEAPDPEEVAAINDRAERESKLELEG
jgi:hypothetical protein